MEINWEKPHAGHLKQLNRVIFKGAGWIYFITAKLHCSDNLPFYFRIFLYERKYLSVLLLILNSLIFRKFVNNLFSLC